MLVMNRCQDQDDINTETCCEGARPKNVFLFPPNLKI